MTTLIIFAIVIVVLVSAGFGIHNHSVEKYDYKIFTILNLFYILIPYLLLVGIWFNSEELGVSIGQSFLIYDPISIILAVFFVISLLGRFLYITKRTNIGIALVGTTVQIIILPLALAALLIFFFFKDTDKDKKKKK